MTGKIKADQALEHYRPPGKSGAEENQEARGCTSIRDHVQYSPEPRGLVELSGRQPVESIQETADAVETGTRPRVQWHVVERCDGQYDAGVALKQC